MHIMARGRRSGFEAPMTDIAFEAGVRWRRYRRAGGPRNRILTDFLIGAHAVAKADAFPSRDRGFYASYFPELGRKETDQ